MIWLLKPDQTEATEFAPAMDVRFSRRASCIHWAKRVSHNLALPPRLSPEPRPSNIRWPHSPVSPAFRRYIRGVLATAGFAEIAVERAHPAIIGGSPEEEARQALMVGPTARLPDRRQILFGQMVAPPPMVSC